MAQVVRRRSPARAVFSGILLALIAQSYAWPAETYPTRYPGFESSGRLGFAFPAKTPKAVVDRMHGELIAVLNLREVQAPREDLGLDPAPSDPASFLALIKADHARWDRLVGEAGLRQK